MNRRKILEIKTLAAAAENGINTILFRNAMGRRLGLNMTDTLCLTLLGLKGDLKPTELSEYIGLSSGSTTAMLDRLERKGFITRKPNPKDRRGLIIKLKEEHSKVALPLVDGIQNDHKDLISKYSDQELEVITDFLNKIVSNLVKHTKKMDKDIKIHKN